jgi:hypothetical protein
MIGHSAGGGMIQMAANWLYQFPPDPPRQRPRVMCTFLDGATLELNEGVGTDWSEFIFARDAETHPFIFPFTDGAHRNTYDVDVTWIDPAVPTDCRGLNQLPDPELPSSHGWPVDFYCHTINPSGPLPVCGTPTTPAAWEGNGFGRSMEGGNFTIVNGEPVWPATTLPDYDGGLIHHVEAVLGESPCPDPPPENTYVSTPAVSPTLVIPDEGCTSSSGPPYQFTLANCPPTPLAGGALPEPAWINMALPVPANTSAVQLSFEFMSMRSSQGLLSVYWNGDLLSSFDERFTDPGINTVFVPIPKAASVGTHALGIRLDAFSSAASTVVISGIRTVEIVPIIPCAADVNDDGVVNVDDLLGVILSWGVCPVQPTPCFADIDGSGSVNVDDLLAVITGWGPCP